METVSVTFTTTKITQFLRFLPLLLRMFCVMGGKLYFCKNNLNDMKRIALSIIALLVCCISINAEVRILMEKEGGVYKVPCEVNGLKLKFIFDTGAASVCISETYAEMMLENGYLEESDIKGFSQSTIADGSNIDNVVINLRNVEIGGLELENVSAVVVPTQNAPLLLGQSVIQRLGKVSIDGEYLVIHNANNYSEEELDAIYDEAEELFEKRIYSEALKKYKILYDSYGDDINPWILYYIGFCYIKLDDRRMGEIYYLKAIELANDDKSLLYEAYSKLTTSSFLRKDYKIALNYARLALNYSSTLNHAHCLYEIAEAYYWQEDYRNAFHYYNEAINDFNINKNNKEVLYYAYDYICSYYRKGDILIGKSHYQEALDTYNKGKEVLLLYHHYSYDDTDYLERLLDEAIRFCHLKLAGL